MKTKNVLSVLALLGVVAGSIIGFNYFKKHKSIADKPTEEEIRDIVECTIYDKSLSTGLCHETSQSTENSDKPFFVRICVPCDSLKKVKVIEVP